MTPAPRRVIYLHGFASGPGSRKAQMFRACLAGRGIDLAIPDLNPPDFRHLSVEGMLCEVEAALAAGPGPAWIIGSSLGGYLAALAAGRSGRVAGLVLLAPAFDLRRRWAARVGPDGLAVWRRLGTIAVHHHGHGEERQLGYRFFEESASYPAFPEIPEIPTLLFHGARDDVIPLDASTSFAAGKAHVRLRVLDDGHDLLASMESILEESCAFLHAPAPGCGSGAGPT